MRRLIAPVTAVLALGGLAGCSSGSGGPDVPAGAAASAPVAVQTTDPAGDNFSYAPPQSIASPSEATADGGAAADASPSCNLPDGRDIIVRYQVAGMPDAAQELGEADLATCVDTATNIRQTADMQPGSCTWVAWADQNPGYDVNADVAPPLKHVLFAVGPSC